jgi:hypothetical protein
LVKPTGRVWIMPDGSVPGKQTDAGLRCAQSLLMQIAPHRAIRWVKLAEKQQPTDWSAQQLKEQFNF